MLTMFVFGLFGLAIGSFLNVLILRWGKQALTGRSACGACRKVISWYDLVPVFSWIFLHGRCRACGARISMQYVLVEVSTGVIFALIGGAPLLLVFRVLALPIAALFIAITVYDFRHTIIPDAWVYAAAGLSLMSSLAAIAYGSSTESAFVLLLAGPSVSFPLFAIWFASRGAWMGFGDVKLALAMGWLLGITAGLQALLLAFIIGALASLPLLFFSTSLWKRIQERLTPTGTSSKLHWGFTMKSEIPFGPFLIAATFIIWISNMYGIVLFTFGV